MDRNGKKAKVDHSTENAQRSDLKSMAADKLGKDTGSDRNTVKDGAASRNAGKNKGKSGGRS